MGSPPSAGARGARVPGGIPLRDGYQTLIAFANLPAVKFFELTVGAPGVEGGDPIDITTMLNSVWATAIAQSLKTLTPFTLTAAYDPDIYSDDQVLALINVNQAITVHFPDFSTLAFYGYLQNFEPAELTRGEFPEITLTIVPTNTDPDDFSEQGPVMTEVAGT